MGEHIYIFISTENFSIFKELNISQLTKKPETNDHHEKLGTAPQEKRNQTTKQNIKQLEQEHWSSTTSMASTTYHNILTNYISSLQ
jgi:hypothetical protein